MPTRTSFTINWGKEDFTKHGYLATYAIGECRCDECQEHWNECVDKDVRRENTIIF